MAIEKMPCPQCGESMDVATVETIRFNELTFSRSIRCSSCGYAEEQDGLEATQELRELVASVEGVWAVSVDDANDRTKGIGVARKCFGLGLDAVKTFREYGPLCVGIGTQTEMEWLAQELSASNIIATVEKSAELTPPMLPALGMVQH